MANDYMDSWELNGDTVLLQDFGKGKNNGVGVLDENGKIPLVNVPAIYTSNLITSKEDERKMTLKEWTDRAVPFFKNYGTIWNDDDSEYFVTNYYAEPDIKFARKHTNVQSFISIKGGPYQSFRFSSVSYCVNNVLGFVSDALYYCYMDDLTLRQCNYTYITPPQYPIFYSFRVHGAFVLNNTLFSLCWKNIGNDVYYISLMTSTDGINFVEQYEHEYTYSGGHVVGSETYTAAYNNGTYVFRSSYFTLTLKDNTFYYNEESTPNKYARVYFFKGVFTDLHQWSIDGITWTNVSYPDREPSSDPGAIIYSIGVLFNKIVFTYNGDYANFWYTEDGKTVHYYHYNLYIGEHIDTHQILYIGFPSYSDNGVLFCVGRTGDYSGGYAHKRAIYATKDAEHFTELFITDSDSDNYSINIACDKGKVYISSIGSTTSLHKQSPDPDLWLPYSTFKNYIKGGN